ncbi:MAG: SH3 domain-containing protein [Lachnospiraceae bacterium]|nr:SH3 domain-containing protein [Lachnospiraceae bacterium]
MKRRNILLVAILAVSFMLSGCEKNAATIAEEEIASVVVASTVSVSEVEPEPEPEPILLKECFPDGTEFVFSADGIKALIKTDIAAKITVSTDKEYTVYLGVKDETKPMVVTVYDEAGEVVEFADAFGSALSDAPSILEVYSLILDKEGLSEVCNDLALTDQREVTEADKEKALNDKTLEISENGLSCVLEMRDNTAFPAMIAKDGVSVRYEAVEDVTAIADLLIEPPYTFTGMEAVKYSKDKTKVMSLPSKDGEELGALSLNDEVTITGQCNENGWFRVAYNDAVGYIDSKQLMNQKYVDEATRMKTDPNVVWEGGMAGYPYSIDGYVLNTPIIVDNENMYLYFIDVANISKHLGVCETYLQYMYFLNHTGIYCGSLEFGSFTSPSGYKIYTRKAKPAYMAWEHDENGNRTNRSAYTENPNDDLVSAADMDSTREYKLGTYENTLRYFGYDQWIAR